MRKEDGIIGKKLSELSNTEMKRIIGLWIVRDFQNIIVDLDGDILSLLNSLAGSRKKVRVIKINNFQDVKEAIDTIKYSRYYRR